MEELNFTINKFIRSFKPLRKLPLTLSEVNAIEYILSYQLHDSDIIITNKAVGKYLMMKTKSATNLLNGLAMKGYISIDKNNLKNPEEEPTRYLTVNIAFINEMLDAPRTIKIYKSDKSKSAPANNEETRIIEAVEEILKINQNASTEDTNNESYFGGNYGNEDNEYSRMLYTNQSEATFTEKDGLDPSIDKEKSFLDELNEFEDETSLPEERLEIISYKDDTSGNRLVVSHDTELLSYEGIDNEEGFITFLQRLIRREDMLSKRSSIQYIIDMKNKKDLIHMKGAYEALVLTNVWHE